MEGIHGGDIYRYGDVIDFSANINPFGPTEGIVKAAKESMETISHYPDIRCKALREKLAVREQVSAQWLFFGNGAADIIFALVLAVKPKRALIQEPAFAEYERALRAVDCEITYYRTYQTDGFRVEENILEQITGDLDILFLCNPNNPTGTLLEPQLLENIQEACRETKTYLILDECFMDFVSEPQRYSAKSYVKQNEFLFLLKAFTKLYAMAGIRLGYGICSNLSLLERLQQVTQPWNVSVVAQTAGLAALEETAYVTSSRKRIAEEKRRMIAEMKKAGYVIYASEANYIFFEGPENLWEVCLNRNLLIRDCSNYRGLKKGYYRVAVKKKEENDKLLALLSAVMQKRG